MMSAVPGSEILGLDNLEHRLGNQKCPDGRLWAPWDAGQARREGAPNSCYTIQACCMSIPGADALSSWLLLDSLHVSSPNKFMFPPPSQGLFLQSLQATQQPWLRVSQGPTTHNRCLDRADHPSSKQEWKEDKDSFYDYQYLSNERKRQKDCPTKLKENGEVTEPLVHSTLGHCDLLSP